MFGDTDYDPVSAFVYVPFEEQVGALAAAQRAGKIRRWGVSNETPWGLARWASTARSLGVAGPGVVQNAYNLLCRNADAGLVEACTQERIELQAYSPLAMGLLTGKYSAVASSAKLTGSESRLRTDGLAQAESAYDTETAADHHSTGVQSAETPLTIHQAHERKGDKESSSPQEADPTAWEGPADARLIRYRRRYAEAESRCAGIEIYLAVVAASTALRRTVWHALDPRAAGNACKAVLLHPQLHAQLLVVVVSIA